jgi:hypothetical protein
MSEINVNELQRLIEEIQAVLAAETDAEPQRVESLEAGYAAAVADVNARLRECDELMRSGHHAEAIQRAEVEPNLLDLVAVVDFSEAAQWIDYVAQFGLPAPPRLRIELAAELNEAYATVEPLKNFLRRHRLHALARSPLSIRIPILRRITEIDNKNPVWDQDIRAYERARLLQIPQELTASIQERSVSRVLQLNEELRSPAWRERPSKAILAQAADSQRRLSAESARGALEQVVQDLIKAFSAFDVDSGRALRERFHALRAVAELPENDPLVDAAGPSLDWLASQDARESADRDHQAAVARLEAALAGGEASREKLAHLHDLARQDDRELEDDLGARVTARIRAIDRARVRKTRLTVAAIVCGTLLAGAILGVAIVVQQRSAHLAQAIEQLDGFLADDRLTDAQSFVTDLQQQSPAIFANGGVQERAHELENRLKADEERRLARQDALASAQRDGLTKPTWESLDRADQQAKKVEELSKGDDERRQASELVQKLQTRRRDMETAESNELDQRLAALSGQMTSPTAPDKAAIDRIRERLRELEQGPRVGAEARTKVERVIREADNLWAQVDERERRQRRLAEISEKIGRPENFLTALRSYGKEFPDEQRSAEFQQFADKEGVVLVAMQKWNQLIHKWQEIDFTTIRPADAEPLLKESQELMSEMSYHPAAKQVEEYRKILQVMQERNKPDGTSISKDLEQMLGFPLIRNLYYLREVKAGIRYYCNDPPTESENRISFSYIKTLDLKKTKSKSVERSAVKWLDADYRSPQRIFGQRAEDLLSALDRHGWEPTFYELLSRLAEDRDIEPILKLEFLKKFIPVARAGSSFLHEQLKEMDTSIQGLAIDYSVNWIDPDDTNAKRVREQAEAAFNRLPEMKTFKEPLDNYLARLRKPSFGPMYDWCGWLYRDPRDSKWSCGISQKLVGRASQPLYAFSSSSNGDLTFQRIGLVADGYPALSAPSDSSLREGRPVFFERRENGAR